jgi:hypothetical protein
MADGKECSLTAVQSYINCNKTNKFDVLENLIKYLLEQKKFFKIQQIENLLRNLKKLM